MSTATITDADAQVARNVRILMAANDLTQSEVADRIGMDYSSMSRAMRGHRHWKLQELHRIAEVLGVTICTLFEEELTLRSRCFLNPSNQMVLPIDPVDGFSYLPTEWVAA